MRHEVLVRAGISVVEVMVALLLTGVAILAATGMLRQVEAVTSHIAHEENAVRVANTRAELLRGLVRQVISPHDTNEMFDGDQNRARFQTMCRVARGWLERCVATVRVIRRSGAASLLISAADVEVNALEGVDDLSLLYLVDVRDGGRWVTAWGSTVSTPYAIGLIRQQAGVVDTVFLRIGERG